MFGIGIFLNFDTSLNRSINAFPIPYPRVNFHIDKKKKLLFLKKKFIFANPNLFLFHDLLQYCHMMSEII
jgi:hypothetical protein